MRPTNCGLRIADCGFSAGSADAARRPDHALFCILAFAATPLFAQDCAGQGTLEPVWIQTLDPGIEWAQPIAREPGTSLAVATRDQRLWFIDVPTGRQLSSKPIPIGPGAVLVPPNEGNGSADRAYLFDRHAAYAVRASSLVALAWRYGTPVLVDQTPDNDPEVFTGWTHAGAVGSDLLLVGSAGRVVLLSAENGRPRWEIGLGRLPLARLHVMSRAAVVLHKAAGEVRAAFIDCSNGHPIVTRRPLGRDWPLWSGLVADGLVTLSARQATLWPRTGPPRRRALDATELRAAAIAIYQPPDAGDTDGETHGSSPALWLGDAERLKRYELSFAGCSAMQPSISVPCGHGVETVSARGRRVIARGQSAVSIFDADIGTLLGTCRMVEGRLVASHVSGRRLHALFRSSVNGGETLTLRSIDLSEPTTSRPVEPGSVPASQGVGRADELRQVLWTGRHLVLVERNAIRAYKLP